MTIDRNSPVLVVDDSGAVRGIVRKILTTSGFVEVDEASDGVAAVAKMKQKAYGLVISDWNMEPMNGKALLEQARASYSRVVPFIIMTTESEQYKILEARYTAVRFISKPFNAEGLESIILTVADK
jgi:two-component system chemotaxis response regulator CheY